jgi:hypothetical protein
VNAAPQKRFMVLIASFIYLLDVPGQTRRSNSDEQHANLNWAESSSQAYRNKYALMAPISNPSTSFPGTHFHILIYSLFAACSSIVKKNFQALNTAMCMPIAMFVNQIIYFQNNA